MTQFSVHDSPPPESPENPDEVRAREEAMGDRDPTFEAFEAGFWAGRGEYRNVLEGWHAHIGQEPPTSDQYLKHYALMGEDSNHLDEKPGYYYEHTNGTTHLKPFIVVDMGGGPDMYFDSPMVRRWWKVEDNE